MNSTIKLKDEDKLLLYCARTHIDSAIIEKINVLLKKDLKWDYLLEMASRHKLMPLLYYNLQSSCLEKVPENILNELKNYFYSNVRKNLLLTLELINVFNLLKSNGISAIPYKGPILANLAYDNIGLRKFNDIDIFIEKSNVLKVKKLLISKGYRLYLDLNHISDFNYFKTQREYLFVSKNGILIEIHWNFQGPILNLPFEPKFLYEDLEIVNINNSGISTFTNENLILILVLHSAKHDWDHFSFFIDLSNLINNHDIKWDELLKKAAKMSIKRMLFINLIVSNDLLDLKIPDEILNHIYNDNIALDISASIEKGIFATNHNSFKLVKKLNLDIKKRDKLIFGIKDCIKGLFTPSFKEFRSLKLHNDLFFLYFIYRPFNLLKRYKLH